MEEDHKAIIIMPAFNEAGNIASTIEGITSATSLPILVVDDASTDETAKIARGLDVQVLSLAAQLGAWCATQAGMRYAILYGYETVITIDADGQHDVHGIRLLLDRLQEADVDMVIGSCTSRGSMSRKVAWSLFRAITGLNIQDLTSGFRAYSKDSIKLLSKRDATGLDYQDVGILCLLRQAGLTIAEVSVCMYPRNDGKSRIFNSWLSVLKYMIYSSILALGHAKLSGGK